jgi:class 3 adenylate cyclase/predicted ATPase
MAFDEILSQVRELLEREGRMAYRILKRRFALTDDDLEDVKADLIDAKRLATDEDGKVLVWVGASPVASSELRVASSQTSPASIQPQTPSPKTLDSRLRDSRLDVAERRQLTVMFCDLVGSTALSAQLDPEELREVVRAYQQTSAAVIERFDGHIAQYLGDGLLVYFGYPVAHEDDAARAVRAGLDIVHALQKQVPSLRVPSPLVGEGQGEGATGKERKLQVRIGIHTGPVVVGEMGGGAKRELLALGETPNIAARIQGQAEPDTVVISAATYHLVEGLFECEDYGQPALKGVSASLTLYRVVKEGEAQSRFQVVARKGLTPLVGREPEFGLLRERWERVKDGDGQAVLLSGEPGIGKSRLVEALKDSLKHEDVSFLELRCSPYHQNSALYPVIEYLQRILQFTRDDSSEQKLDKLEQKLARSRLDLQETVPLFASLLSLSAPRYTLPALSPQKQKKKTLEAFVAWLCAEAKQQAVTYAWEDLHWADPSTLELLTLFLEQVPTTRLLAVLTFRPEFTPPWGSHSYLSQLILSRLGRNHVETMVEKVTGGKALPAEVVQQIVSKTDGVPLFVEELTKMVVEQNVGAYCNTPLLGIPATLQDALMARLDRLGAAKEIAQVGATIGREFNHDLLQAISSLTDETLQQGLRQLIEAELVYQSGRPPQATYLFKHALIQDTAYQSLLKSRRQQLHQQVAQVLAERFPQTVETQPELVAHHYSEASLIAQAVPYWQQAGELASKRSAHAEAISHLTKGLEVLKTQPDTPERIQQELRLQIALGPALMATEGYSAPAVERAYARAQELCLQIGETPQLFRVLGGLWTFYLGRAEHKTARKLGEQLLTLAQNMQDPSLLMRAHTMLGPTLFFLGEFASAQAQMDQGIALYGSQPYRPRALNDPGVICLVYAAWNLWHLGYPNQALEKSHEALTLAHKLFHPFSLAVALQWACMVQQSCRRAQVAQEQAEALITLSTEQGFTYWLASGTIQRGWALVEHGQGGEGIARMRQGLAAFRATNASNVVPYFLARLAEAYGKVEQAEEGLAMLAEALALVDKTGERMHEAELYRLKGTLMLQQESQKSDGKSHKSQIETSPHPLTPSPQAEAEGYFLKAIEIARKQQAKSLELRATMSLARLWQHQGKTTEAHQMLADIYNWFTEGFDTKDLQEAKALLEELA